MDTEAFKAQLTRDGYDEVVIKDMAAGSRVEEHTHPFDVRALVLAGELTLTCGDKSKTYRTGDILELDADVPHVEQYGDKEDYKFLVGKRNP